MIQRTAQLTLPVGASDARQRLDDVFLQAGFRREVGLDRTEACYSRGSKLNTAFTLKAANWYVKARAQLQPETEQSTGIAVDFQVSTAGQVVMPSEQAYWDAEVQALREGIENGQYVRPDAQDFANKANRSGLLFFLLVALGMLAGSLVAVITTGRPGSAFVGLFLGGTLGGAVGRFFSQKSQKNMPSAPVLPAQPIQSTFNSDVRGWGVWLMITGVMSLIASAEMSSSWGVMLIVLGAGSFVFRTPALYVIYGCTLLWAAIQNALMSGDGMWMAFSLLQVFLSVRVFMQFRRFNRAYQAGVKAAAGGEAGAETVESLQPDPYAGFLPWISLALGFFSLLGFGAVFIATILLPEGSPTAQLDYLFELMINLGLLGFTAGLGSLLSRHRFKGASIAGLILGGLVVLIDVLLMVLVLLG
ncbi:MAG: hypothetical protein HY835_00220 [Anaerolineae bacterium]|nr:hypothetical protein [Anaerolineae bacterium]